LLALGPLHGLADLGIHGQVSWIPGEYHGLGAALEFDANYGPKPAYESLRDAMR